MLLKTKIMSGAAMGSELWRQTRLSKFTASRIHCCMGERGIGEGGLSYIRSRIGEELTGISSEKELDSDAIRWGLMYEPYAIKAFGELKQLDFLVTQKLICDPETKFGATPDAIWVKSESTDGLSYEVATAEVKCYPTYENHIACSLCSTPLEIKLQDKQAYWQTIMQMDEAGALVGHLCYFHPDFRAGQLRVIEFRKINIVSEFKLLKERQNKILEIFNRERELMINIKN